MPYRHDPRCLDRRAQERRKPFQEAGQYQCGIGLRSHRQERSKPLNPLFMNRLNLIIIATSTLLSSSLFAGPREYKQVVPPPPPILYGTGLYGAIDLGANVYQDGRRTRTLT